MDYAAFVTLAQELIADAGRLVTVQKFLAAPKNTAKPWEGTSTDGPLVESEFDVFGAFVPASGTDLGQIVTDKELLKTVEQVVLVPGDEEHLETFTAMVDGEVRWKIEWAQVLRPGPLTVLYAFGVKR